MQPNKSRALFFFAISVCGVYFLTGVTALSYEVLWARMLSTVFGVSTFGVVVTISAFMAGLGGGSFVGGRIQHRVSNPLLIFGLIELLVAIFAFNLPGLFSNLDQIIQSITIGSSYALWISTQAIATFILMFIPALGLGFGFPLILKSVSAQKIPLGVVYSLNTLGGMIGAILPLFMLPIFGWIVSERLVAIVGATLGMSIIGLSYFYKTDISKKTSLLKPSWQILTVYAGVGASAIMLEIAWTRLYGMILLRTEYVMAIILATFLLGIGLGSLLSSRASHKRWLSILPLVISVTALTSVYLLPMVSAWAETVTYASLISSMLQQSAVIAIFTLPATLAFGAWLPILVSQHKNSHVSGAYFYGANSIGGALGGLFAGFVLIPYFGTGTVIAFSAFLILLASLYWSKNKWFRISPILILLLSIPIIDFPSVKDLLPKSHSASTELQIYEDALMVTHVVEEKSGQRLLLADLQRMDASTAPDAITVQKNQSRLPLILQPEAKTILFLGLGTGITAAGSLPYANLERTAIELSQGAIHAASSWFEKSNKGITGKLKIIKDDARRYLKSTDQFYDIILGDLFHPDLVGRSNLLSVQQFQRAKDRLTSDGIFVQWIALNQFDIATLKVVLASFKQSFPNNRLFVDGFRIALVGAKGDFTSVQQLKKRILDLTTNQIKDLTGGEGIWSWMGRYWGGIPDNDWIVQDEWAPVIEFQLPKAKFNRQLDLGRMVNFILGLRVSQEKAAELLKISTGDREYFNATYQASLLYYRSWLAYFSGQNLESQKLLSMAYATNPDDQWIAFGMADAMFASIGQAIGSGLTEKVALEKIIRIRPNHVGVLKRLLGIAQNEQDFVEMDRLKKEILKISPLIRLKE